MERLATSVISCCIRVHKEIVPGFLEAVYHRALELELAQVKSHLKPADRKLGVLVNFSQSTVDVRRVELT